MQPCLHDRTLFLPTYVKKRCPAVVHPANDDIRACHVTVGRETEPNPARGADVHCELDRLVFHAEVPQQLVELSVHVVEGRSERVVAEHSGREAEEEEEEKRNTLHRELTARIPATPRLIIMLIAVAPASGHDETS